MCTRDDESFWWGKARTESECISAGYVTAAISHSEGAIGSWRNGTGERLVHPRDLDE